MNEMSKSTKRRYNDPAYHLHFFAGDGLDIGGGDDPLGRWVHAFARMKSCRTWDKADGDAQELIGVASDSFDFVASSHCLEHLHKPAKSLANWIRVVKPGGFISVSVPDAGLYEGWVWPSRYNADHKHLFTTTYSTSAGRYGLPVVVVQEMLKLVSGSADLERLAVVRDFHSPALSNSDQTLLPNVESAIEFVLRKHG